MLLLKYSGIRDLNFRQIAKRTAIKKQPVDINVKFTLIIIFLFFFIIISNYYNLVPGYLII